MKKIYQSFLLIFSVMAIISCGDTGGSAAATGPRADQARHVTTTTLPTMDVTTYQHYPTRLEGIVNSEARPKVSGYITSVLVDEGQKVSKGQVLFRLETASLSEQAEAAKASIEAAEVEVNQLQPLVDQNIVSENQLATAKARLAQAKASYNSIVANIDYAVVRSPVNGYVGEIRIRSGNLVSPNDPRPLTTVADISKVYAYFSLNEKDYLDFLNTAEGKTRQEKIANMPEVTLIMANGDEYAHKGKIETINSQIDRATGTISFRAVFDNPEQFLTNGSSGQIRIPVEHKDVVVVPRKSSFEQLDQTLVVLAERGENGMTAKHKRIFIAGQTSDLYIIEDGVKAGDKIIVESVASIRDGSLIETNEVPFDSASLPAPTIFRGK